jgi:hypothetical protein
MQFQPKAEDECKKEFKPIPKGEYAFEVLEAIDTISKEKPDGTGGNEMIQVTLAIWQGERVVCRVWDYLLPSMEAKLRHACDACGLLDRYQSGNLQAADFLGRTGRLKIKIKKETSDYPAKNEVEDYCCRPAKGLAANRGDEPPPLRDEDLPF